METEKNSTWKTYMEQLINEIKLKLIDALNLDGMTPADIDASMTMPPSSATKGWASIPSTSWN